MRILMLFVFALFFAGCVSTTNSGAVGANRTQLLLVSAKQMQASANEQYAATLTSAKIKKKLNTNKNLTIRVQSIAKRLIAQTPVFREDAKNWAWEVNVVNEDTLNAWCMPGGKIVFYSGLITKLNLNDAQIAAIMGHEMAHALREHARERTSQATLTNAGLSIAASAAKLNSTQAALAGLAAKYTIAMPFSRTHESESDKIGIELMARAGYDPYEAPKVWEKMTKAGGGQPIEILSTHPSHETRIKEAEKYAKIVYPLYEQSQKANTNYTKAKK